ncbi:MAG: hypothetical protein U0269_31050 [Polyangiales bacterium]
MRRSVERSRPRRWTALCVASLLSVGCLAKPTEVIVLVNSNAPTSQAVLYRLWVRDGVALATHRADAAAQWAQWPGRNPNEAVSFALVPKEGSARNVSFSFRIEATSANSAVAQTRRAVFTPGSQTTIRVAINFDCGLSATGCRDLTIPCTVERLCEERGQTCGAAGTCIPIDDPTEPFDGGLDGATLVVPGRADASSDAAPDVADESAPDAAPDARVDSCTRNCAGRACGDDGCGGSCGGCAMGQSCNAMGQCVAMCSPNCTGRQCGSDGCGGSCGSCTAPNTCNSGRCSCTPSCPGGRDCGMSNGCGGQCTGCPSGLTCAPATGACRCTAGCSGSTSNCRDNCGYVNTACTSQCPANRVCNMSTGNCDCRMTCGTTCCPSGTLYCRGSTCCTDCGVPSAVCNVC